MARSSETTGPVDPGDGEREIVPRQASPSTHFMFRHRVFTLKGCHFALSPASDEPMFNLQMGELKGSITLPALASEFGIDPETEDGRLLGIVARSLRFVRQIRPGDSIPSEILDGTSSWSVGPHHETVAIARLSYNLIENGAPGLFEANEFAILERMAHDDATRARVSDALVAIARRSGQKSQTRDSVFEQLERVARELAYIEALRERHEKIRMIERKIGEAAKLYRRDRALFEEVQRIQALLKAPLGEFPAILQMAFAQMADMRDVLGNVQQQLQFIRTMRDELHVRFMRWEDMIQIWDPVPPERGETLERTLRATYRFLARYFPQRSEWTLTISKG